MKKVLSILALVCMVAMAPAWVSSRTLTKALQSSTVAGAVCVADIGGSGCTFSFSLHDSNGMAVAITDGSGNKFVEGSITLGASAGGSIPWLIANSTITDNSGTTHTGCIVPAFDRVRIRCLSGASGVPTMAVGFGGLVTGATGTGGTGWNTGYGPGSKSIIQFYVGDADKYGLGGN